MKSVTEIASYLLGAEAIVLSIVYVGVGQGFLKNAIITKTSSVFLIAAIFTCVLVLTGSINYAADVKRTSWRTLAQLSSNLTVWAFFLSLLFLMIGVIVGA